jgi:hypothetical protein
VTLPAICATGHEYDNCFFSHRKLLPQILADRSRSVERSDWIVNDLTAAARIYTVKGGFREPRVANRQSWRIKSGETLEPMSVEVVVHPENEGSSSSSNSRAINHLTPG